MNEKPTIRRVELMNKDEIRNLTDIDKYEYWLEWESLTLEEKTNHNQIMVKKLFNR